MSIFFTRARAWALVVLCAHAPLAASQTVETFAGGRSIDNLPATAASVNPSAVAAAPDGTVYMVDWVFKRLLRRDPMTATLYTIPLVGLPPPFDAAQYNTVDHFFFAPNGTGYVLSNSILFSINPVTGLVTQRARLWRSESPEVACNSYFPPHQFAVDGNGAIYYTDFNSNAICKIVNTLPFYIHFNTTGFSGDGGPFSSARINRPAGIAVDAANNIYIADQGNHRIRKITVATGIITTIAGNGSLGKGGENLLATATPLSSPGRLTFDAAGNLYGIELGNYRVRRLDAATGRISTASGNGLQVTAPQASGVLATSVPHGILNSLAMHPSGDLLISDDGQRVVRRLNGATGIIDTIAGNGAVYFCGESSLPRDACIDSPGGIAVESNGDVYIADSGNRRVRKYFAATGLLATIAGRSGPYEFQGNGGPALDVVFPDQIGGLALDDAGNLYIAGTYGYRIYRIDRLTGILTSIAGTGASGFTGDGGPATAAKIGWTRNVAVDPAGNVYFSEQTANRVRRIAAGSGVISTYAGTGVANGALGDGGPATAASLSGPSHLAIDKTGNLLIVDYNNNRVRRVDKTTGVITTAIGNGQWGTSGDGGPATAASIAGSPIAVDAGGNVFMINGTMRKVDAQTGIITTVPNVPNKSPEGFSINPTAIAFDANGRLYDATYQAVLRISGLPTTQPDSTPPVIIPTVTGLLGDEGWYKGDVQVLWAVTDAESPVVSTTGCAATSVTQDTTGVTVTCTATSGGGSNSNSVTIKRDATPPTVTFGALSPAPNANGWNNTDVTLPYTISDDTSGVALLPQEPLVFTHEGVGVAHYFFVTDRAGNSATYEAPLVKIDRTAPLVSPDVTGAPGTNGWYRGDVQVGWSISEFPESVESMNGCETSTVSVDTTGTAFTCTVTSAGGTTSSSVTVQKDSTVPTLGFGAPTPAANAFGWHNSDVYVPFTANDATSGVASTSIPSPLTFTNEGLGVRKSVTVTDLAGNSATFQSTPLNIDKTGPLITPVITGPLGNNDWYVGNVTVEWTINEMPESIREIIGCEGGTVTTDTDGVMFGCVVNSGGGSMAMPAWVKRDTAPPTLLWGAFSPAPNANGWNKTDVSVPFTAGDALSGIAGQSANNPLVITAEGEGVTGEVTLTDKAGNEATFNTAPRNIDKTAPVITINSPANGATYGFYQDVEADYECDDVSLASCTAPTPQRGLVNTRSGGTKTFKVTGKDLVNFTSAATNTFTVESTFHWSGFAAPANPPVLNRVARNTRVPIRWQLPDGHGGFVTNTAAFKSITSSSWSCGSTASVPYTATTTAPVGISFDWATASLVYSWSTGSTAVCRTVQIELRDGSQHEVYFKVQ